MLQCCTINQRHREAIDEYLKEQAKPDVPGMKKRGLRKIAEKYNLWFKTIANLVNGGVSMSTFNASKQKLSHNEEQVLVDFITESADRGCPLTLGNIAVHANAIIKHRVDSDSEKEKDTVGQNWVSRFLDRYRDELQTHWSRPLDTQRAKALNPESVKAWFDLVEEQIVKCGIKPHNIYGMDESGFPPSNQGTQRVVGRRGTKLQHKTGSANRENVTAIVTICTDGTALRPTIIFKGKNFMKKWGEGNVSNPS